MPDAWTDLPPPELLRPRAPGLQGPRLSVVMTTYQRAHLIGETVASVLKQGYRDFELLVRDDGQASDGTEEAVSRATAGDPRVRYSRNPKNLKMPGNLNAGIADSVGEYVAVCHDHDLLHPDYLSTLVDLLDRHPNALFAHCGIEMVDQAGISLGQSFIGPWPESEPGHIWAARLLESFHCPVCALALVRREAHEKFGLYDAAFGFVSDVEMWMRLSDRGDVAYAAQPLVKVRTREDGHEANSNPWPILATVFAIHRRYLPRRYWGLALWTRRARLGLRADISVVRELAARLRRGRPVGFGLAAKSLGGSGGPVTRALAAIATLRRELSNG